eukprot:1665687-Amphidinium_carterae.1
MPMLTPQDTCGGLSFRCRANISPFTITANRLLKRRTQRLPCAPKFHGEWHLMSSLLRVRTKIGTVQT